MIALLLSAGIAIGISFIGTPFLIRRLRERGIGQPIREDGPAGHITKAGTPTMGGLTIVAGTIIGYLVSHLRGGAVFTWGGILVVLAISCAGLVGFLDDWIKVRHARNLGLNKRTKFAGLLIVAIGFAVLALRLTDVSTQLSFTRAGSFNIELGTILWASLAVLMILGTANAVNLTDGLDGLAAGSGIFSFGAYVVIGFWAFRHYEIYSIPQALDLALVASSMMGACVGFLWWNAAPARIFMGDTGSLAIGTGLAGLALLTNTHLLLPLLGGIYVIETLSVIIQVISFRLFHRRVFRMAPIHHHFELAGWPETTVIIRFWLISGIATAGAVGLFYADYLSIPGVID